VPTTISNTPVYTPPRVRRGKSGTPAYSGSSGTPVSHGGPNVRALEKAGANYGIAARVGAQLPSFSPPGGCPNCSATMNLEGNLNVAIAPPDTVNPLIWPPSLAYNSVKAGTSNDCGNGWNCNFERKITEIVDTYNIELADENCATFIYTGTPSP